MSWVKKADKGEGKDIEIYGDFINEELDEIQNMESDGLAHALDISYESAVLIQAAISKISYSEVKEAAKELMKHMKITELK